MYALQAIATGVRNTSDSPVVQIIVIVVAAFIVAFATWFTHRVSAREERRARELKEKDEKRTADMEQVKKTLSDVSAALITPPKTPLNPFPKKGLLDGFDDLRKDHFELKKTVMRMDARSEQIKEDTTTLVHETTTNAGGSMRDTMDAIQAEQGKVRTELDEKNTQGD